jgi:hypothetical protein
MFECFLSRCLEENSPFSKKLLIYCRDFLEFAELASNCVIRDQSFSSGNSDFQLEQAAKQKLSPFLLQHSIVLI